MKISFGELAPLEQASCTGRGRFQAPMLYFYIVTNRNRGIISPLGLRRLPAALFKGRTREERVYGDYAFEQGKFIKAKLQENLVANSLTKSEVSQARNIQTRDMPLVIVSSGIEYHKDNEWAQKQKDLTVITDKLLAWDVAKKAPHEVWRTFEGRELLEKRLADLIKAYWRTPIAT